MAEPEPITQALRELIEPHLKEHLEEDSWEYIDDMFDSVIYTYPGGLKRVTLNPIYDYPAMQFSCITGEYLELTDWDYIQTVDTEAQIAEAEAEEARAATISALEHYHIREFHNITDYDKVYDNRTTLTVNGTTLYKYDCVGQTIYLKADNYPVTYDKQAVDEDYYYYNFDTQLADTTDEKDLFNWKVSYEWVRNTIWGYDPDAEEEE